MVVRSQIPEGAEAAVGVAMAYSATSWICSCLMIWLTSVHGEGLTYVAMVAYFSLIATTASIIQQVHSIVTWRDLVREQFERRLANGHSDSPEMAIANGSFGTDLVLFYIQYYTYNVMAMCVMFWAASLAVTVYGWNTKPHWRRMWQVVNNAGRLICIFLPLITITSLQSPAIRDEYIGFVLLADLPLMLSLFIGSATMLAILLRYVHSQRKLTHWSDVEGTSDSSKTGDTAKTSSHHHSRRSVVSTAAKKPKGIYDRWLMVRFICSFVLLAIFEVTNTLFQITSIKNAQQDAAGSKPDFTFSRAQDSFFLFMPGVTPGIFIFLIFGTTTGNRRKMCETFVPQCLQDRFKKRRRPSWTRTFFQHRISIMEISLPTPTPLPLFNIKGPNAGNAISHDDQRPLSPKTFHTSTLRPSTPYSKKDLMKPLPTPPPPTARSLYSHTSEASMRKTRAERILFSNSAESSNVTIHETVPRVPPLPLTRERIDMYYETLPEHSDSSEDPGVMLPIMRTRDRDSRG